MSASVVDGFVQTIHGRIHYHECGSGFPLILLHSNGGSAYEYEFVIEQLGKTHRVIAWDMPGHGDSDPVLRHYSVPEYADAVVAMMDALDIPMADVAGDSIGGAICAALGARQGSRMRKLFVMECPFRTPEEWKKNWHNTEANYAPVTQTIDKVAPRFRKVDDALMVRWNIDRSKAGTKTTMSVMWALRLYDMEPDLRKLPAGTFVVFGDRSPTVSKKDEFARVMNAPQIHVIENCGHFPMIDDPQAFCEIIEAGAK